MREGKLVVDKRLIREEIGMKVNANKISGMRMNVNLPTINEKAEVAKGEKAKSVKLTDEVKLTGVKAEGTQVKQKTSRESSLAEGAKLLLGTGTLVGGLGAIGTALYHIWGGVLSAASAAAPLTLEQGALLGLVGAAGTAAVLGVGVPATLILAGAFLQGDKG